MRLHPPSSPPDAFFAPVRRRHPDVDIVVLPPAARAIAAAPVTAHQVAATLDRVAGTAERIWSPTLGAVASARLAFGPAYGTVVASARCGATTPDGFAALAALRGVLEADGWQVRRLAGEVERLTGERDDLRVQASYAVAAGALLVEVRSQPMTVGRVGARELVRR